MATTDIIALAPNEVAAAFWPQTARKGFFSSRPPKARLAHPSQVFPLLRRPSGCELAACEDGGTVMCGDSELVLVSKTAFDCLLEFIAVRQDDEGHSYDVAAPVRCTVTSPLVFAERLGPGIIACDSRLKHSAFGQLVGSTIEHYIRDQCANYSAEDLRSGRSHTRELWEDNLSKWLGAFGCRWDMTDLPTFTSMAAEAARIEQEQRKAEQDRQARENEHRQAELAAQRLGAEMEDARREIEHDACLNQAEREQRKLLLEKDYALKQAQAQAEIQKAQWRLDEAALEHQARMAELTGRRQAAEEQGQVLEELQQQHRQVAEHMDQQHKELLEAVTVLRQVIGGGLQDNLDQMRDQLAKAVDAGQLTRVEAQQQHMQLMATLEAIRASVSAPHKNGGEFSYRLMSLLSSDAGFSAAQLRALGFNTALQDFVSAIQSGSSSGKAELKMRTLECLTRDPFVCRRNAPQHNSTQVSVLRIGQPLNMELTTKRAGYVTLLNFGTSGAVSMFVPNVECGLGSCRIEGDERLTVPGPRLLPWNVSGEDIELREGGPVGREHMLLIVSREPLLDAAMGRSLAALRATADDPLPILKLSSADIQTLHTRLTHWDEDQWDSAVLSFDVVPA